MNFNNIKKVFIIAEIGINHEGDFDSCKYMISMAKKAGADAVKLQSIFADKNYTKLSPSYKIFKSAEFSLEQIKELFLYARQIGIEIFTTAGDIETVEWINENLEPKIWKISSGLLNHFPLLEYLASLKTKLILSTGMSKLSEIDKAVDILRNKDCNYAILQCTSLYPTPAEEINLASMSFYKERYGCQVGFSDHSVGHDAAFLSVAAGAKIIEKHFTIDSSREGYDHHISLEPIEFEEMVKKIRNAEVIIGSSKKTLSNNAKTTRKNFLRCVVANEEILKGSIITKKNISIKRPAPGSKGSAPEYFDSFIGLHAKRDIHIDSPILIKDLE